MLASPHWLQAYLSQATVHSTAQAHSIEQFNAHQALALLVTADFAFDFLDFTDDLHVPIVPAFTATT